MAPAPTIHPRAAIGNSGLLQVIQDTQDAYGINISLPFTPSAGDPVGFNLVYSTREAVQTDLINLILTQKGERLMNPDFGTNLHALLFEQNTPALSVSLENEILAGMELYKNTSGIGISNIKITIDGSDNNGLVSNAIKAVIEYKLFGEIENIVLGLLSGPGPTFASYSTTAGQLMGTTLNEISQLGGAQSSGVTG